MADDERAEGAPHSTREAHAHADVACLSSQQAMCLLLREALTVGKIAMAHEFFSNELKHVEAKLRIKDELSSYCVVTEAPKTTFGKVLACAPVVTMQPTSPHPCSQPQPGAPDVHGQALWYAKLYFNRSHPTP